MNGNFPLLIAGGAVLLFLAFFSVIAARRRDGESKSLRSSCLGCLVLALFSVAVVGAIVRGVSSISWRERAESIEVATARGVELFGDVTIATETIAVAGEESSREVRYASKVFAANVTPQEICSALFPGSTLLESSAQGVTTAESPEGHWVGTATGVVLRGEEGTLDSLVLFVRTIAEAPEEGSRVAVVRARDGSARHVSTDAVGIELSESGFLDRFLRLDDPPRLTLDVRVDPIPERFFVDGVAPRCAIDAVPPP